LNITASAGPRRSKRGFRKRAKTREYNVENNDEGKERELEREGKKLLLLFFESLLLVSNPGPVYFPRTSSRNSFAINAVPPGPIQPRPPTLI
jgi:hypothetical protein